jgi:hypothetical protein
MASSHVISVKPIFVDIQGIPGLQRFPERKCGAIEAGESDVFKGVSTLEANMDRLIGLAYVGTKPREPQRVTVTR